MLMVSDCASYGRDSDSSDVDIPAIDRVSLGHIYEQPLLIGSTIDDLHFGKLNTLLISRSCGYTRNHHELHKLLTFPGQLSPLCLFQTVFG